MLQNYAFDKIIILSLYIKDEFVHGRITVKCIYWINLNLYTRKP